MMNKQTQKTDTIIVGGGLIGLLQALSLSQYGISSAIIDHNDETMMRDQKFDGRTSAVTSASMNMLKLLNLNSEILGSGEEVAKIMVRDGKDGPPIIFDDGKSLATVFENQKLRNALLQAAISHDKITPYFASQITHHEIDDFAVRIMLDNGTNLAADILIGADGSNSKIRQSSNIGLSHWQYDNDALVAAIAHKKPHNNIAYELFFPEGPLALLPMPTQKSDDGLYQSSLIWSVPEHQSQAYKKLSPAIFCHTLNKKTGGILGQSSLTAPLISYPLGFHSAAKLTAKRTALIGDSAHRVHPIAGQGLNLGFRDVAALTEILVDGTRLGLECGDTQLLERYERWRSVDNLSVSIATDSIHHIYGIGGTAASKIRRMGMNMIEKTDSIKNYLTQEARGAAGELPKMLSGNII